MKGPLHLQETLTRPGTTDHGRVTALCRALCARYPALRPVTIGRSVLGRQIEALVLTPPDGVTGDRQRVLLAAAFHAQEWLTALCALRLCEDVCRAQAAQLPLCGVRPDAALREREVWFVPMVDPDGVQIAIDGSRAADGFAAAAAALGADTPGLWQANVRGVDINHNFNAGWARMQEAAQKNGWDRPGARRYPGPQPESEPETRSLTDLCRRYAFRHVVALHSQGEEIYWQYGAHTPPQSEIMARVLGAASGYAVAAPEGFAADGGFKDWFIRCFGRPGFTIELGRGVNPLPVDGFEEMYAKAQEMLLLSLLL